MGTPGQLRAREVSRIEPGLLTRDGDGGRRLRVAQADEGTLSHLQRSQTSPEWSPSRRHRRRLAPSHVVQGSLFRLRRAASFTATRCSEISSMARALCPSETATEERKASACTIRPRPWRCCSTTRLPTPGVVRSWRPAAASARRRSRSSGAASGRISPALTSAISPQPRPRRAFSRLAFARRGSSRLISRPTLRRRLVRSRLRLHRVGAHAPTREDAGRAAPGVTTRRKLHNRRGRPQLLSVPFRPAGGSGRRPWQVELYRALGSGASVGRRPHLLLTATGFATVRISRRRVYVDAGRPAGTGRKLRPQDLYRYDDGCPERDDPGRPGGHGCHRHGCLGAAPHGGAG